MAIQIRNIKSTAIPLRGNDIDTDRIIPARFLKCITFEGLGEHAFEDDRLEDKRKGKTHPFDLKAYKGARILVVNKNFGCGSSREHAPQSLSKYGIRAIVGESFAGIFFGNCVSIGVPCLMLPEKEITELQNMAENKPETEFEIDLEKLSLKAGDRTINVSIPGTVQEQFIKGHWDITGLLLDNIGPIKKVAGSLPYMKW